jgi:beta-N-acetylglucosaminidase
MLLIGIAFPINTKVEAEKYIETSTNLYNKNNDNIHAVLSVEIESNTTIVIKPVRFNPNDVTEPSNITESKLQELLQETNMLDITDSLIYAEKEYGVNTIFLASLVALESGWGTSDRAINDNNLGGVGVYTSYSRGTIYNSRQDSVLHIARFLKEDS